MPTVVLGSREQAALRALLAAEPVPGRPLPDRPVLRQLTHLIPCDALGFVHATAQGALLESVDLPSGFLARAGFPIPGGHQDRPCRERLRATFHLGPDRRVHLWLARFHRDFDPRDLAVLDMVAPALRRLVRERPAPHLAETLTVQERRVLDLVLTGCTNAEIADRLTVAPSTVRKHLEHTYRKLGVTSRLGAVAALRGGDAPGLDLQGKVERFA